MTATPEPRSASTGASRGPRLALLAVGVLYVVAVCVRLGLHWGLNADEAIYLSQIDPKAPDLNWAPWRAWGMPVLVFPVGVFSPGIVAIRAYTVALSAVAIVGAFWTWLKVLPSAAVPVAALLFVTSWEVLYFGSNLMPNFWTAIASLAVVGVFLQAALTPPRLLHHVGLAVLVLLVALIRPSDSVWLLIPLGLSCLFVPRLRRPVLLVPMAIGEVLGWLPWVIEAFVRFGGPLHRYHLANETQAVGGLHPNLVTARIYLRILDEPSYGYPGARMRLLGGYDRAWMAWVAGAALLVVIGLIAARSRRSLAPVGLAVAVGVSMGVFYVFLLTYGAVRFLLPVMAMLSIPVAVGLVWLVQRRRAAAAAVGVAVAAALVAGHAYVQMTALNDTVDSNRDRLDRYTKVGVLLRDYGVRRPCVLIYKDDPTVVSYNARCHPVRGVNAQAARVAQRAIQADEDVVVVTPTASLPAQFSGWTAYPLPGVLSTRWQAWFPPGHPPRSRLER